MVQIKPYYFKKTAHLSPCKWSIAVVKFHHTDTNVYVSNTKGVYHSD